MVTYFPPSTFPLLLLHVCNICITGIHIHIFIPVLISDLMNKVHVYLTCLLVTCRWTRWLVASTVSSRPTPSVVPSVEWCVWPPDLSIIWTSFMAWSTILHYRTLYKYSHRLEWTSPALAPNVWYSCHQCWQINNCVPQKNTITKQLSWPCCVAHWFRQFFLKAHTRGGIMTEPLYDNTVWNAI